LFALVAILALATGASALVEAGSSAPSLGGTISYGSFHSRALRGTLHYAVYLPPGYGGGSTRYPVVYFLHGLPASENSYRAIGPVAKAIEQAHRQAIVIGAQGARNGDEDPEWLDRGPGAQMGDRDGEGARVGRRRALPDDPDAGWPPPRRHLGRGLRRHDHRPP
jgi:hypothetical protein